jgi:hypothetical protein
VLPTRLDGDGHDSKAWIWVRRASAAPSPPPSASVRVTASIRASVWVTASVRTVEVKRVTAVTTTEAQGGAAVEAKCATAVEQRPPSFTLRHNRRRRRSSLDGGPLLWQLNDGGHGSRRGDAPLLARR